MAKLPAFQFYPGDWMKDPNLRRSSLAARGLWIDMLCLMFECEERGVLISGGRPWTQEEVAAAIGGDTNANLEVLRELIRMGVARMDNRGAMFSPRLVRDEEKRQYECAKKRRQRSLSPPCPHECPHPVPALSEDEDEDEEKISVKGGAGGKPEPPTDLSTLVPVEWNDLFLSWYGRTPMPIQYQFLGERIRQHGLASVKAAMEIAIGAGVLGKFPYLDAILANGCQQKSTVKASAEAEALERGKKLRDRQRSKAAR